MELEEGETWKEKFLEMDTTEVIDAVQDVEDYEEHEDILDACWYVLENREPFKSMLRKELKELRDYVDMLWNTVDVMREVFESHEHREDGSIEHRLSTRGYKSILENNQR